MAKRRPSGDGMVRKKEDGRWEGRIVVGHKANGAPIFRYVYGRTQKELLSKLHQSIETYQDVELTEDSRMTLGEWLDRWLDEYKAGTIRHSTMYGYRQYARLYIKPILGDKVISRITSTDIQRMYTKLKREGRIHEHPEYGYQLSDAMLSRIHAMLHQAMKDAVGAHLIAKNPTEGTVVPKPNYRPKQILNEEQLDTFMAAIEQDEVWRDFFFTELTTGLRRGEICGLRWEDFDEAEGTLKVNRSVSTRKAGSLEVGETKTNKGHRSISLPDSTAQRLRERKKTAISDWIFPNPLHPEEAVNPGYAYNRMKTILKNTGLPSIRFHDLRHTFATMALGSGMDVKTLSSMLGHVSAATTLDIYTHITNPMRSEAAAKIDQRLAKVDPKEKEVASERAPETDPQSFIPFIPYNGKIRKAGTGCITQISEHCWEGRYSPVWPDGKKHSRNVYAKTREECEALLPGLIEQMKAEIKAIKESGNLEAIPDGISEKKKAIAAYMREHPEVTSKSAIAKAVGTDRSTVRKYYNEI